jgi:Flp pilus assembly pilin Flp
MTIFTNFLRDESGAVTIDWVALTAGILLLGIAVVYGIFNSGVSSLVGDINSTLSTAVANGPTITGAPGQSTFE